jgi:hypothetical protein
VARAVGRVEEEGHLVRQLRAAGAEGLDAAEGHRRRGVRVERRGQRAVGAGLDQVVVVEERHQPPLRKRPALVAHHGRVAARRRLALAVGHARVGQRRHRLARRALGRVVEHQHLDGHALLRERAAHGVGQEARAPEGGDDDGDVGGHGVTRA